MNQGLQTTETVEIDMAVMDSADLSNIGLHHVGDAAVELVGEPSDAGTLPERVQVSGTLTVEPYEEGDDGN